MSRTKAPGILQALSQIENFVCLADPEQNILYNQIKQDPGAPDVRDTFDKLLLSMITAYNSEPSPKEFAMNHSIQRLASHLQSHVSLLQVLIEDPELASLFLIGESGNQAFSQVQLSILEEQIARTQKFLQKYRGAIKSQCSTNYKQYMSEVASLSEKLDQISELKTVAAESTDFTVLRAALSESLSVTESVMVFNDVLIHLIGSLSSQQSSVKQAVVTQEQKVQSEEHSDEYRSIKQSPPSSPKSAKKSSLMKQEILELQQEKDTLQAIVEDLKAHVATDQEAASMVTELKQSLERVSRENEEMKKRLNKTSEMYQSIKSQIGTRCASLQSQLSDTQKQNQEMAKTIAQLQNQIQSDREAIDQKEKRIGSLEEKVIRSEGKGTNLQDELDEVRNELSQVRGLYQKSSTKVSQLKDALQNLEVERKKLAKESKQAKKEVTELHQMLENANEQIRIQTTEKTTLIKQIDRQKEIPVDDDLVAKYEQTKAKLVKALALIEKLYKKIRAFKQGVNVSSSSTNEEHHHCHCCCSMQPIQPVIIGDCSSLKPYLDDLDSEIRHLDCKVQKSKKAMKISSSSACESSEDDE